MGEQYGSLKSKSYQGEIHSQLNLRCQRYSDEPAYENHLRQTPIRELSAWLSVGLGEAPKIWTLEVQEDCNFTKPEVIGYEDPTIVFTDLG
jgi:hypothetical protein